MTPFSVRLAPEKSNHKWCNPGQSAQTKSNGLLPYATGSSFTTPYPLKLEALQLDEQMLFEAGYKGEVVVNLRPKNANTFRKVLIVAKQRLKLAGFKAEIVASGTSAWVARLQKKIRLSLVCFFVS
jgi:hypothetical protein